MFLPKSVGRMGLSGRAAGVKLIVSLVAGLSFRRGKGDVVR